MCGEILLAFAARGSGWRRRSVRRGRAARSLAKPHARAVILTFRSLEFGPLVGCEDVTNSKEHSGVGLFEFCASLSGVVDLREDLVGVGLVCGQEWTHELLLLIEGGVKVHQLRTILLEDVVHALLLVGGEVKFLDDISVM